MASDFNPPEEPSNQAPQISRFEEQKKILYEQGTIMATKKNILAIKAQIALSVIGIALLCAVVLRVILWIWGI